MTIPTFSCRDPLQAEFWDQRFAQEFTPWDKGGLPAQIQQFVVQHAPMNCLIPGCGNAYEVALFAEHGWQVAAIDFSAEAIRHAQQHLSTIDARLTQMLVQADFFSYNPPFALQCIYERAFLCALPPKLWPQVAARWAQLLPAQGLLAGYFFIAEEAAEKVSEKGPPFCSTQQRLDELLSENFVCIENAAVADSIAVFAGKERWQVWQRK